MTFHRKPAALLSASIATALALAISVPASAQVTHKTEVSTSVSHNDGVATRTTKVVHVKKRKTRRVKRILGVKVGHKTAVTKTVRTTTASSNGAHSSEVKVTH